MRDLPTGNWLYEMKFDGYRALAFKAGQEVRLISRNRIDFGDDYPPLLDALKSVKGKNFIIDGEIAALDQHGKSSFQLLQSYGIRKNIPLVYYAFDLLRLGGTDVHDRTLLERRKLLAELLKGALGFLGGARPTIRSGKRAVHCQRLGCLTGRERTSEQHSFDDERLGQ